MTDKIISLVKSIKKKRGGKTRSRIHVENRNKLSRKNFLLRAKETHCKILSKQEIEKLDIDRINKLLLKVN